MAETVPENEPATATAGNTWTWTKRLNDYAPTESGGTWTLSYIIAGPKALAWNASWVVTSGNTWTITIPASSTASLTAGRYQWSAVVTGGGGYAGQRFTPATGTLVVAANPELLADGDALAFAERNLSAVEAVLEGRITADIEAYTIGGKQVTAIPVMELMQLRSRLRYEVWLLRNPGLAGPVRAFAFRRAG